MLNDLTPEKLVEAMERELYVADKPLALSVYLSLKLEKPLLIEGEPGCGKTEVAKVLAKLLNTDLIRLQCYEGITASQALYEWDYPRQLINIRLLEDRKTPEEISEEIFSQKYLLKRPLLATLLHEGPNPPVLLIDEIDRSDEEFEGFLLEFLAEFQVTIPELGTISAKKKPVVIITSNRTREVGDGLRRRCLYLYVTYPSPEKERRILSLKVPQLSPKMADEVVAFVQKLRQINELNKKPGISETIDWANALNVLGAAELNPSIIESTLSCLIKNEDDLRIVRDSGIF
ncbi:MAG: MoxR family ATPase [Candidatus Caldarchaeum sp.]|nr:MoxR family ATPase [Candidatus Caldarchaeum sp.]MDW7978865.1 MoxR family ATPase [Candidatus Caldarchaeum sp.]MDW8360327.1 MoxR family ATPase [Candidatus Caldarchaeum sp.]